MSCSIFNRAETQSQRKSNEEERTEKQTEPNEKGKLREVKKKQKEEGVKIR